MSGGCAVFESADVSSAGGSTAGAHSAQHVEEEGGVLLVASLRASSADVFCWSPCRRLAVFSVDSQPLSLRVVRCGLNGVPLGAAAHDSTLESGTLEVHRTEKLSIRRVHSAAAEADRETSSTEKQIHKDLQFTSPFTLDKVLL